MEREKIIELRKAIRKAIKQIKTVDGIGLDDIVIGLEKAIADELEQQPDKELFEKVYIRSEEDLPEEDGRYYVHNRGNINEYDLHDSIWLGNMYKEAWLRHYDFYLRPLE